jgi:hypothetical protein
MYELIFTMLIITKTGLPGFNIEQVSRFQTIEECEKRKGSMQAYVDKLVNDGKVFPGIFDCRKISR